MQKAVLIDHVIKMPHKLFCIWSFFSDLNIHYLVQMIIPNVNGLKVECYFCHKIQVEKHRKLPAVRVSSVEVVENLKDDASLAVQNKSSKKAIKILSTKE